MYKTIFTYLPSPQTADTLSELSAFLAETHRAHGLLRPFPLARDGAGRRDEICPRAHGDAGAAVTLSLTRSDGIRTGPIIAKGTSNIADHPVTGPG